ncbi:DUF5819 family protein [Streptomyces sp. NPDC005900]|uniref:DUF5819 family protein n=1 Tax=Streptomyces sp. NPDC005900 TaxID=3154569 RepID=UPI00340A72D4
MDGYDEGSGGGSAGPSGSGGPPGAAGQPGATGPVEPAPSRGSAGHSGSSGPRASAGSSGPSEPPSGPSEPPSGPSEPPSGPSEPPSGPSEPPPEPSEPPSGSPRPGIAGLKLGHQIVAACALALIAVVACVHIGMLFFHVAPSNTLTKRHGDVVDDWIYPEFEQNWKLFAPNPLQQNVAVQARAELRTAGGGVRTTDWYDLSAQDGAAIDGSLLPSHTRQNELRRAWDFYVGSHDAQNRPVGLRGRLSERYVRRIAYLRLEREGPGGAGDEIARVQVRSRTTSVRPPKWSEEKVATKPVYRLVPWWSVTPDDLPLADAEGAAR